MKIDKSDYYPYTPGNEPEEEHGVSPSADSHVDTETESLKSCGEAKSETHPCARPQSPRFDEMPTEGEKFVTRCCNIISWILVPMLVSVYATMMIFGLSSLHIASHSTKAVFTLIVFGFNAVLPMLLVFILKAMGIVQDVGLNGRQERLIPYIIMIISYMGTAVFFHFKGAPLWMCLFYAGGALAALINMLINFRWKISAHAAAIAGVAAMLLVINRVGYPCCDLTWWMLGTVLAAGLLGSARIWLGRHTLAQVLAGYAVGFLSVYLLGFIH
ncbi:MAG: hypothetical protein NC328_01720 [Muribaculum sp.]|nr:hypothetical protein [Muribaculum sp.]